MAKARKTKAGRRRVPMEYMPAPDAGASGLTIDPPRSAVNHEGKMRVAVSTDDLPDGSYMRLRKHADCWKGVLVVEGSEVVKDESSGFTALAMRLIEAWRKGQVK